ncbi:MAG: hypothetical protein K5666_00345 [Bacilli bacterium]|nr:hypothetical protein [Bacilli bacterium]
MEDLLNYIMAICSYEKTDYEKLIWLLVNDKELDAYVQEIKFKKLGALGMYIPNDKLLKFNMNKNIRRSYLSYYGISDYYSIEYQRLATINLLLSVLHELYHVEQAKMADDSSDDSLHKVVREGMELGRRSPKKLKLSERMLYRFHYHKVLTERSAEIISTAELLEYRLYGLFTPAELRYLKDQLIGLVNRGYKNGTCPCEKYYSLRNKKDEYNKLDFNDKDYDLLTRLAWGFPVDDKILKDDNLALKLVK